MTSKERFNELKSIFLSYYKDKTGEEYYFSPKDAKNLKLLQNKIEFSCKNANIEIDKTVVGNTLQVILKKMPMWYQTEGLEIAVINSGYNKIIAYIKQNKQNEIRSYKERIISKYISEEQGKH